MNTRKEIKLLSGATLFITVDKENIIFVTDDAHVARTHQPKYDNPQQNRSDNDSMIT